MTILNESSIGFDKGSSSVANHSRMIGKISSRGFRYGDNRKEREDKNKHLSGLYLTEPSKEHVNVTFAS